MKRRLLIAIGVVVAIAGSAWFGATMSAPESVADDLVKQEFQVAAATVESNGPANAPLSDAKGERENVPNEEIEGSLLTKLDEVLSVRDLYPELIRRANLGDTSAMHALTVLAVRCRPFSSVQGSRVHPRNELANLPLNDPMRGAREQALHKLSEYCAGDFAPGELVASEAGFRDRLASAAANGDVHARAANLFAGEDEATILEAIRDAEDPAVVEAAMHGLSRSGGPLVAGVIERAFPSGMRAINPSEVDLIMAMAASWRGCQLGRPCGANRFDALEQCALVGNCSMGRDVMANIQQRELSGRQFELMQRYLAELDSALKAQP